MRKCVILVMLALVLGLTCAAAETVSYDTLALGFDSLIKGQKDISVPIQSAKDEGAGLIYETVDGQSVLTWVSGEGSVTFDVEVEEAGLYNLEVEYAQVDALSGQIERGLMINGERPFSGCENFLFLKRYYDLTYPFEKNKYGNEILPRQEGIFALGKTLLYDREAFIAQPLLFYFYEGPNSLTLTNGKGAISLAAITLKAPKVIPAYDAYSAGVKGMPAMDMIMLEAEHIAARSSKGIQNLSVSEPGITPQEPGNKPLNTLGGAKWDKAYDFVEWRFQVDQAGLYQFAFNYRQSFNTGMTSFRRVEIDGKVPFEELYAAAFPFGASWQQKVLGDQTPYRIYLDEGEHTLRLVNVNTPYRGAYQALYQVVSDLKALDLYVKEIVGAGDDIYRIWKLEKYIPTIQSDVNDYYARAQHVAEMIKDVIGGNNELGSFLAAVADLKEITADYNLIARNTSRLSDIYNVLSTWMDNMTMQPLELDKLYIAGADERIPSASASFFEKAGYFFSNFWASFVNAGSESMTNDQQDAITVWVQRSRDYVDLMQLLADEYFTKETGLKVRVSYCPPGTQLLVLANASGEQPDVVTGTDIALPFEFGIRNALVDLSKMDGFDELVSHVAQGSRIPYYFSGKEFGIAEEIRVKVAFYRKDVLNRLGIKVPDTWDEMRQALSTLLQNNYALYYPYGDYLTFFFQNGVEVYTPDGLSLAFTNEKGYAAFKQWTDLYVKYGLQPEMTSFYQHFRIGDVPLGITEIDQYIQFDMAAPDISGLWDVALIPGTYDENGLLQRWQAGTQTGAVMFKTDADRQARAWEFMKWWMSTDTQYLFADSIENYYGQEFRLYSANLDVVKMQAWDENTKKVLLEQLSWYKQLPMVPGGSYMTSRELWNAWTRIVIDKKNYREQIEASVADIELELAIKQREMGYIDGEGHALIPMDIMGYERKPGKGE